jgi:lysozyme
MTIQQGDKGIDVSRYQVFTSYDNVAKSGVKFGYVKATEGSAAGSAYVSPVMDAEFRGLKGAGIEAGFYHFARYVNVKDAQAEADWFISHIKNYDFTLPPALDLEYNGCGNVTVLQQATVAFLEKVEEELGSVVIYLSATYYNLVKDVIQDYGIWLADPTSTINIPKTQAQLFAWQNNWHGAVNGIAGEVDIDIACGAFFLVKNPLIAPPAPVVVAPVVVAPKPVVVAPVVAPTPVITVVPSTYTVRSGDTVSEIAQKFGLTVDTIEKLNGIDPKTDAIFVGQILKLKATATVPSKAPVPAKPVTYIVKSGDTVSEIAAKFGLTVAALESLNGINPSTDTIYVGQVLTIKK